MSEDNPKSEMIARIVASYAARPDVGAEDIVHLYNRLAGEAEPAVAPPPAAEDRPVPAVPVERAISEDSVTCLCCGRSFKMLKRHLGAEHGLSEAEYRNTFGLPENMPLVAPSYSQRKADYAKKSGFGKYSRQPRPEGARS